MSRNTVIGLTLLVGVFTAGTAAAQQTPRSEMSMHQRFQYDKYRNNQWPMPFRGIDTSSVLSYFEVQRNNGWKLHNTLGAAMFDPATNTLTDAGRNHMKWIVTQAPQDRRVLFVLVGDNQQETAARVEATQIAVSEMIPVGPLPTIYLTDRDAPGSSGVYQTAINRAINGSVPNPRLTTVAPAN